MVWSAAPSETTVSCSSRILMAAGMAGPLNVSSDLPPSERTRNVDRCRRSRSSSVSNRQSSCSRRPSRGVAPSARILSRASSALSKRSLISRSRATDSQLLLADREELFLAAAHHQQERRPARCDLAERPPGLLRRADGLTVDARDDVATGDAGAERRAALLDVGNEDALGIRRRAQAARGFSIERAQRDP